MCLKCIRHGIYLNRGGDWPLQIDGERGVVHPSFLLVSALKRREPHGVNDYFGRTICKRELPTLERLRMLSSPVFGWDLYGP